MAPNFSENKWVNLLITSATPMIAVLFTAWLATSDMDARELKNDAKELKEEVDSKATKAELKTRLEEAKEYTNRSVENLRFQTQTQMNSLEKNQDDIKENQVRQEGYLIDILNRLPPKN